jgi:hypothetical protein
MTREEAIKAVGLELVEEAERDNCDYTNRVTEGTEWQGYSEFAGFSSRNENGDMVVAYYYQPNEVLEKMAEDGDTDLGGLDWEIDHYEVI